jgi:hypothetical protein
VISRLILGFALAFAAAGGACSDASTDDTTGTATEELSSDTMGAGSEAIAADDCTSNFVCKSTAECRIRCDDAAACVKQGWNTYKTCLRL